MKMVTDSEFKQPCHSPPQAATTETHRTKPVTPRATKEAPRSRRSKLTTGGV